MKKFFSQVFSKPQDQEFVSLMQVALEDAGIREQLLKILSMPDDRRRATVRQWRSELSQQNAPKEIMKAMEHLEHDTYAHRAKQILEAGEL